MDVENVIVFDDTMAVEPVKDPVLDRLLGLREMTEEEVKEIIHG